MPKDDSSLKRIDALTQSLRGTWFGYLFLLAFSTFTLAQVQDVDFFSGTGSTELPIIGISVPTAVFVLATSLIITVYFAYLHVALEQLWKALAVAPARVDSEPLSLHVQPWLVSNFALILRRKVRSHNEGDCIEDSTLGSIGFAAVVALLFLATPTLIAAFWYVSLAAHIFWASWVIAVFFWTSTVISVASFLTADSTIRGDLRVQKSRRLITGAVFGFIFMTLVTCLQTIWDPFAHQFNDPNLRARSGIVKLISPKTADLSEVRFTEVPFEWLNHFAARQDFFQVWCKRPDAGVDCKASIPERPDTRFQQTWRSRRENQIGVLQKPSLRYRNLRHANLSRSYLPGVDFRESDLSFALMRETNLESAKFNAEWNPNSEQFRPAARLIFAVLNSADLTNVDFSGASSGNESTVEGADLSNALLSQSILNGGDFSYAILTNSYVNAAEARYSRFRFAELSGSQLSWTDFTGSNFSNATIQNANLTRATFEFSSMRAANFMGSNLNAVKLQSADLSFAKLELVNLTNANLEGTILTGASISGALHGTKLSGVTIDQQTEFSNSLADASIELESSVSRPCQWIDRKVGHDEFWSHWRGWIEAGPGEEVWLQMKERWLLPDVAATPPPTGCKWK